MYKKDILFYSQNYTFFCITTILLLLQIEYINSISVNNNNNNNNMNNMNNDRVNWTCNPNEIDIVYLWINGSEPHIINQMKNYGLFVDPARIRDYNTLKYSFRSIEKHAPWIRNIVLVTSGEIPNWLDTSSKKIKLINHHAFFKNPKYLPTWSSTAIESQFYNLPPDVVSDCFLYFNDDMFLFSDLKIDMFFDENKKSQKLFFIRDLAGTKPVNKLENLYHVTIDTTNNMLNQFYHPEEIKAKKDPKRTPILQHKYPVHNCYFFQKKILKKMQQNWPYEFEITSSQRTRNTTDLQFEFLYNHVAKYEFNGVESSVKEYFRELQNSISMNSNTFREIEMRKPVCVCLNDGLGQGKLKEGVLQQIDDWFLKYFPNPSSVEKK